MPDVLLLVVGALCIGFIFALGAACVILSFWLASPRGANLIDETSVIAAIEPPNGGNYDSVQTGIYSASQADMEDAAAELQATLSRMAVDPYEDDDEE